ncbi:MAG TPA: phosphatidylserine decarboxylase [Pyrinomonadaceae bacterium]|nr:phosphatidylserine decarboxylase [Pyrinomonadaceae bacterium]
MVRDGIPFVVVPIVLAIIPFVFGFWWAAIPLLLIAGFMAYFFRNPRRSIPSTPGIVVAPADGRVTLVRPADDKNRESLVSIFLSPFDVHVNRAPIAGEIVEIAYKKGRFLMATKEESRDLNEQNRLTIKGDQMVVTCTQIAGVLARRIVCWKRRGERVECGELFGMIKFGSRTDLLMPPEVDIVVQMGMHVRGGETIIGKLKS